MKTMNEIRLENLSEYDAYHALANAIIERAAIDYKNALKYNLPKTQARCENFFRSQWFSILTNIDGETIINRIKKDCNYS